MENIAGLVVTPTTYSSAMSVAKLRDFPLGIILSRDKSSSQIEVPASETDLRVALIVLDYAFALAIDSLAAPTIFSGVKPYSLKRTGADAEAPKCSSETATPQSPMYSRHP